MGFDKVIKLLIFNFVSYFWRNCSTQNFVVFLSHDFIHDLMKQVYASVKILKKLGKHRVLTDLVVPLGYITNVPSSFWDGGMAYA